MYKYFYSLSFTFSHLEHNDERVVYALRKLVHAIYIHVEF